MRALPSLLLLSLLPACVSGLTVKVDPGGGAPRLVVDGKPVRGRMFWGGPAAAPIRLTAEGGWVDEEFTALGSEPKIATMHFRFGSKPGTIVLDEIQVTDLNTGLDAIPKTTFETGADSFRRDWTFWPTGAANTVGHVEVLPGVGRDGTAGAKVTLTAPADGHWPDWHIYRTASMALIEGHRYHIRFWAKAEPARDLRLGFYRPGATFVNLGVPGDVFARQIKLAGAAGAPFVSFPMGLPWPKTAQEPVSWDAEDGICRAVLAANPNALLLPRIGLDAPSWWLQAHPDEAMKWDAGQHAPHAVPCSPLYRKEAAARLGALVEHLEATFGDHIAGYHPSGQNTGEWFYEDTWGQALNGYSPADEAGFRRWLHNDQATVPTAASRHAAPYGLLRDPVAERPLVDFATFQQETMADWVCEMAHAIKQACGGKKLAVFFYGYVFEFAAVGTGAPVSGHYALRRTLDCPDIDVLCSPISYFDRQAGGGAPSMTAAESVALAGKLWLNEDDTRTYLVTDTGFPGDKDGGNTLAETNALLTRNVGQEAIRNFATWWMDLGSSGWFNDPQMWHEMDRLTAMDRALLDKPTPYRPEVAAVLDEPSMTRLAAGGAAVSRPAVYEARAPMGRMGAPYGQYLQDDVAAGKVDAKLYVMLSSWCLTAQQRAALKASLRGKARIWCWAPGWHDGWTKSTAAMAELTGFKLAPTAPAKALATLTDAGRAAGLTAPLGVDRPIAPLFGALDATPAETLATWPDGSAAVALRQTPDGLSAFVGSPGLTSELLRAVARRAGVHLYTQTDCNVWANGPFVTLHAAMDGPVRLDLGRAGAVTDALGGGVVGQGPTLALTLKKGETRVLRTP